MSRWTITLPWPKPVLWPNRGAHWCTLAEARAKRKNDAYYAAQEVGLRKVTASSLKLLLTFHPPDRGRRDLDNAVASLKGDIDGIALAAGIDDSRFTYGPPMFGEPRGPLGEVVVIVEAPHA